VIRDKAFNTGGSILDTVDTAHDNYGALAATAWFTHTCVGMSLYQDGFEGVQFLLEMFQNFQFLF
jgi:hypothetical protein